MKRYGNLFEKIISWDNLVEAAYRASKGKRGRRDVISFNRDFIANIGMLRKELVRGDYRPGCYREFFIYDKKKRKISAAPFRDRVVHHALCNVIMPIFEKIFIDTSCANRKGKGTRRAVSLCRRYLRRYRYYLQCDIKKYFASIDHEILKSIIRKKIKCAETLLLIDRIVDGSNPQENVSDYFKGDGLFDPFIRRKGLPLGNLTSQYFANIFLAPLDRFIARRLRIQGYVRYVDDFILFHDDKSYLNECVRELVKFLDCFRLKLHENRAQVVPATRGITFLGYRLSREWVRLKRDNVIAARRRIKVLNGRYASNTITLEELKASVFAWYGHARYGDTMKICREVLRDVMMFPE